MPPPSVDFPRGGSSPPQSKRNEKLLSLFLKSVIMMCLISFFFLLVPLASFFLLLSLLLRHRHRHQSHPHHSSGFSSKQLKNLPQFRFSQESKATQLESDSCVICLDGFRQGQWGRYLVGCGHLFHRKCLDAWLIKVAACPICRTTVSLENDDKDVLGLGTRGTEFRVC